MVPPQRWRSEVPPSLPPRLSGSFAESCQRRRSDLSWAAGRGLKEVMKLERISRDRGVRVDDAFYNGTGCV